MNIRSIFINHLFININALIILAFYATLKLTKQLPEETINTKIIINNDSKNKNSVKNKRDVKDVLFINRCNPNLLPHPYRYRVLHQIEQLQVGFLESDEIFYLDFNPIIFRYYRVLIFFVVHGQIMLNKQ